MPKYNVGDIVEVVETTMWEEFNIGLRSGQQYTVVEVHGDSSLLGVEITDDELSLCNWLSNKQIKLVKRVGE